MNIRHKRLRHFSTVNDSLYSCWNARGQYDALRFVLRLRPDIHRQLSKSTSGYFLSGELDDETCLSFSTLLHETIHWWQFIGSTYGFIYSLAYPSQLLASSNRYILFLGKAGKHKSIKKYYETNMNKDNTPRELFQEVSTLLNTFFDIEFFKKISFSPKQANAFVNDNYFESLGHCYKITYEVVLWLLSTTCKTDTNIFDKPQEWTNQFRKLKENKADGFYYGGDVRLSPIGAFEIFEGQARFSQLVYLHQASQGHYTWNEFKEAGYLDGVYIEAFTVFIHLLGEAWPPTISDPLVGLFLLICDISINPTEGFPLGVLDYASFVNSCDPGIRFLMLCSQVQQKRRDLKKAIVNHTRDEYIEFGTILNNLIYTHSIEDYNVYYESIFDTNSIKALMAEEFTFKFSEENMPIRVLLSQHLKFQKNKIEYPHIFCWPGHCFSNTKGGELELSLFNSHGALFVDQEDGDIYPNLLSGKDKDNIQTTFNNFYTWNILFDLTKQWTIADGPFVFDYEWMTSKHTSGELREWATIHFSHLFHVNINDFSIL